jgi:hypothetical protein
MAVSVQDYKYSLIPTSKQPVYAATTVDAAMNKRMAITAIVRGVEFLEEGIRLTVPAGLDPQPTSIAVDVTDSEDEVLSRWEIKGNEITDGRSDEIPMRVLGAQGASLAVTFPDGDTQYYSTLYSDWRKAANTNVPTGEPYSSAAAAAKTYYAAHGRQEIDIALSAVQADYKSAFSISFS